MSADRKDEEVIFYAALEIASDEERKAYIKEACGDDVQLLRRVEVLLKAHEAEGDFLKASATYDDATLDSVSVVEQLGTVIGRYKLLESAGEGGMGSVYLAEQKKPIRRKVALKIVKLGMDTKQVIARFEAERQALAVLDHPNIAHVYDAGITEAGRPYFVMEYVKGTPITEYCDRNKLNVEERLGLFIQVCKAIQHAHQKGIIHRDIKPSNILVSKQEDKAVTKVIDFGVAKAIHQPLTERTLFTEQGQLIGTPEYISPEQAELTKEDIDTRSDIYSLGVLLYELLTGSLPFDPETLHRAAFDEILRIIRDQEPPKPSTKLLSLGEKANSIAVNRRTDVRTLTKRLHSELEWIPLMALRKERDRRYTTVGDLSQDIHNYLSSNPLIAGPESVVY
ncbi:MAG: serine/threonine protein kinase, partial [Planctomycetota bacterium]